MTNKFSKIKLLPFLLIAPCLVFISLVFIYPIAIAFWTSFFEMKFEFSLEKAKFIGLQNYISMLGNPNFWEGIKLSAIYTIGMAAGSFALGLIAALILNVRFKFRGIARVLFISPWAIAPVVTCLIWGLILDKEFGALNYILNMLHITSNKVGWIADPSWALFSVTMVSIWKFSALAIVFLLAGLQTIDVDLYAAATIDGAGSIQQFRHVTLPGLKQVGGVLFLLLVLFGFRRFEIIFVMTGGGPARATETIIIQTYLEGFRYYNMGYASGLGMVTLAISLTVSLVYLNLVMRDS